jgi:hypothetical protein
MGKLAGAKMEMSSPGDTAPVAPLAALVIPLICGKGAVMVRLTLTVVVPVAGLVPATVMVPVRGDPVDVGRSVLSTDGTRDAVRLTVPLLVVVPEVGDTCNQPALLTAVAVKGAADPPPDTAMVPVGLLLPTW